MKKKIKDKVDMWLDKESPSEGDWQRGIQKGVGGAEEWIHALR